MTRITVYMLRRAYEHVVASLGAIALTALMVASVNAQAAAPQPVATPSVKPTVTILVPTVEIEMVDDASTPPSVQE